MHIQVRINSIKPVSVPLFMHKEDRDILGVLRDCATPNEQYPNTSGCPAVWVLLDDPHTIIHEQWQYFVRAINYKMSINHVSALYDKGRALFNKTGFPERHNYLTGEEADQKDPNTDKVRTFSRNVLTGEKVGNYLRVKTFDSRFLPPLKSGRRYPRNTSEINIDDYLITPQTNREMFAVCNIVNPQGFVKPFPNGAVYEWAGNDPFSFFPHISNHGYGEILYSLNNLVEVSSVPRPYRT